MLDTDNGRVTLGVLGEKIDVLTREVQSMRADHDELIMLKGCLQTTQTDVRDAEMNIHQLQDRMRVAELQLARTAVFWGLLSGSGGAVLTVLITKALGL